MTKFKGEYRVESARLPGWDYTASGYYFVTICTHRKIRHLGEIVEGVMHLTPIGKIVSEEWIETERVRPNVKLDEWKVMPNHIHGILIIRNAEETARRAVSTTKSRLKANTLGSIIGQYKSKCTKRIWQAGFREFAWQERYFDHIIEDQDSLDNIRAYIKNNPLRWQSDNDNPENLFY